MIKYRKKDNNILESSHSSSFRPRDKCITVSAVAHNPRFRNIFIMIICYMIMLKTIIIIMIITIIMILIMQCNNAIILIIIIIITINNNKRYHVLYKYTSCRGVAGRPTGHRRLHGPRGAEGRRLRHFMRHLVSRLVCYTMSRNLVRSAAISCVYVVFFYIFPKEQIMLIKKQRYTCF